MAIPPMIYCAAGNKRYAQIAIDAGMCYGAQLPGTVYFPPFFADQDWKRPDRARYMSALEEHRPTIATVLDIERDSQIPEVLDCAAEAAQYVETVIIIPKVPGIIPRIPEQIDGASVRLGYSVPTKYGGTDVPVWEFGTRPVHLLGGSPHRQLELTYYMNIASADGNYSMKLAASGQFWMPGNARYAVNRHYPTIVEANGGEPWPGDDMPYEAFRRSCQNIMRSWIERWATKETYQAGSS